MQKTLYIISSIPGVGKSTFAKVLQAGINQSHKESAFILSADDYAGYYVGGKYVWTPEVCVEAHKYCRREFDGCLEAGDKHIIIDNTNLNPKNYSYYVNKAKEAGYTITYINMEPDPNKLDEYAARNKHGVSREMIGKMYQTYKQFCGKNK